MTTDGMGKTTRDPGLVAFSLRLYQVLLAVYPSGFRLEFGWQMQQVFGDCCRRELRQAGLAGLLLLWSRTLLDTVKTALEEHIQRGVDMSKEKFVKLSGWALLLGGPALVLGWLASTRPEYDRFNASSLAIDRLINVADMPLLVMGMLLISTGFLGLLVRYGRASGVFGRFSLGLAVFSGGVSAIGIIGLGVKNSDPWWSLFFFGLIFQFVGATLFGIVCLRKQVLPRWNGLPLLAGIWVPLFVAISWIVEKYSGSWVEWPDWAFYLLWLLSLVGLAGLGLLLQADAAKDDSALQPA